MEKLSLDALVRTHLEQAATASSGRSATTVYGGHEHTLRQTLLALTAGTELAEHDSPGEATLHVLRGRVRLTSGDVDWRAAPATSSPSRTPGTGWRRWRTRRCC